MSGNWRITEVPLPYGQINIDPEDRQNQKHDRQMRQEEDFRERGALLNDRKRPRGRRGADVVRFSFVLAWPDGKIRIHTLSKSVYTGIRNEADSGHFQKGGEAWGPEGARSSG
ncbi:MAG: hypothetical protein H6Q05_1307 [Acidobacteria bacterium]|nr:hypothetical protein [Acidobacteriota bacterium]